MSVVIRLARAGTKKRPVYHVVVADSRFPRDGRFIERLGHFNPLLPKDNEARLKLDMDKTKAWLAKGAQPSDDTIPITDRSPSSRRGRASTLPSQVVAAPPNARLLLVDDDEGIRDVVGAMLEAVGLLVTSVATGEHAQDKLASQAFQLVVLDWTLPGIGGLELCREIRKNERSRDVPILFLTANASSKDVVTAFAAGADDYVVKPFRAPELGARIFGLLRRTRMTT